MRKIKSKKKEIHIIEFNSQEKADMSKTVHDITENTNSEACLINLINDSELPKKDLDLFLCMQTILQLSKEKDRNKKFSIKQKLKNNIPALLNKYNDRFYPNKNTEVFTILLELILILIEYSSSKNKLIEMYENKKYKNIYLDWNPGMKKELFEFPFEENIKKKLKYEPVFTGQVKEKFEECINWLSNTFYRRIKYNTKAVLVNVLMNNVDSRLKDVYDLVFDKTEFTKDAIENYKKECILVNEISGRVILLRSSIEYLEKENKEIDQVNYKKDLSHFKSAISRTESLLKTLYNLLNFGGEPTSEELKEFEKTKEIIYA